MLQKYWWWANQMAPSDYLFIYLFIPLIVWYRKFGENFPKKFSKISWIYTTRTPKKESTTGCPPPSFFLPKKRQTTCEDFIMINLLFTDYGNSCPKKTQGKRWNLLKTGDNGDTTENKGKSTQKIFYKIFLCDSYIYLFMTKVLPRIE